jgi:hypothetical protein
MKQRFVAMACGMLAGGSAFADTHYLIVSGLGGDEKYAEAFDDQAVALGDAARKTVAAANVVVLKGKEATREALEQGMAALAASTQAADTAVVFLIGHGSHDGDEYKFNLPGRDPTGAEIAAWLSAIPAKTQLVVNATSASGAVLEDWAADGRVLITATRSGAERNATRFAAYWTEALSSDAADLNKNGVVSAQEAFDFASRRVADSFEEDGALATEHPQIAGDNAERVGAARLVARAAATAEQRTLNARLDELEAEIADLRARRDSMPNDQYLNDLQALLVQLATVQRQIDAAAE